MLSYKQWKLLNENFGLVSLGVKSANTVAITGNNLDLDEAKKMKKKMLSDEVPEEEEPEEVVDDEEEEEVPEEDCCDDEEEGDEEEVPEEKKKIVMPIMGMKKKMKKKMKKESTETEEKVVESNPEHDKWRLSVKNMLNPVVPQNWDGISVKEDALLPPSENEEAPAPKPGEFGYSPYTRIGGSWLS
jgi:hypothetical protein